MSSRTSLFSVNATWDNQVSIWITFIKQEDKQPNLKMNQRKIQMDNTQGTSSVVGEMQTKNTNTITHLLDCLTLKDNQYHLSLKMWSNGDSCKLQMRE